jgi:hypothetical protein
VRYVVSAMLLVAALIHLLPVSGVLGVDQLSKLYGISVADPNLEILMRHRAILVGLLGVLLAAAAFIPSLQLIAFIAGFVSVGSFLVVAWQVGGYNAQIGRVVVADLVAVICLVIGSAAYAWSRRAV